MAQHDYIIANQSGAALRSDLNNGLAAIVSQNSGAAQPSTTYAYQWWADTTTGLLKLRNAANNAWITIGTLADVNLGLLAQSGGTLTGALLLDDSGTVSAPALAFDGDTNTGIFRSAADTLNVATNGIENAEFGTSEVVFNDGGADIDFRIESDTNPNLFRIDAGLDEVQVANLNGGPLAGTRNRIINGDMRIDQRAAIVTTNGAYTVDRFAQSQNGGGVVSWAQSSTAPVGYTNSLSGTVTTADSSIASTDYYRIYQAIEGFNVADLASGTANASAITVSFWVRSSITGTYCVGFTNGGFSRGYAAQYTISSANTWEYKTVSLTLDQSGTWATNNTGGLYVYWDLGSGSAYNITANTWSAGGSWKTSSQTSWIATNGATFYITGVQLEPGAVATPFERRSYGAELALCQRYYETMLLTIGGYNTAGSYLRSSRNYSVHKRASPTLSLGALLDGSNITGGSMVVDNSSTSGFRVLAQVNATGDGYISQLLISSIEL